MQYNQPKPLTVNVINKNIERVENLGSFHYWIIEFPNSRFVRLNGIAIQNSRRENLCYWPDYKVAGSLMDIYLRFKEAGVSVVEVGSLYKMTRGCLGDHPGSILELTPQVILRNSLNSSNLEHVEYADEIIKGNGITPRSICNDQYERERAPFANEIRPRLARIGGYIEGMPPGWNRLLPRGGAGYRQVDREILDEYPNDQE